MKYFAFVSLLLLFTHCRNDGEIKKSGEFFLLTDATSNRGSLLCKFSIDGTLTEISEFERLTPFDALISDGKAYILAHPSIDPNTIHVVDLTTGELRSVQFSPLSQYCCTSRNLIKVKNHLVVDGVAFLDQLYNPFILILDNSTLHKVDSVLLTDLSTEIIDMELTSNTLFIMSTSKLIALNTSTWERIDILDTNSLSLSELFADSQGNLCVIAYNSLIKFDSESFESIETLSYTGWTQLKYDNVAYNPSENQLFSFTPVAQPSVRGDFLTKYDLDTQEKEIFLQEVMSSNDISFDDLSQSVLLGGFGVGVYDLSGNLIRLIETGEGTGQVQFLKEY